MVDCMDFCIVNLPLMHSESLFTASASFFTTLNVTTFFGGVLVTLPICEIQPPQVALQVTEKVPKLMSVSLSSFFILSVIATIKRCRAFHLLLRSCFHQLLN